MPLLSTTTLGVATQSALNLHFVSPGNFAAQASNYEEADRIAAIDSTIQGVPWGRIRLTEKTSTSGQGVLHKNIKINSVDPQVSVTETPLGKLAKSTEDHTTTSVTFSVPSSVIRKDPRVLDAYVSRQVKYLREIADKLESDGANAFRSDANL